MSELLRRAGAALLDIVSPPRCLLCDDYEEPFCAACRAEIAPVEAAASPPAGLAGVACVGYHEEALRSAILNLKFRRETALVQPLGELLARELEHLRSEWRPDGLVPVPMHWTRRWERGFDHTELLARSVSRAASLPALNALRRTRRVPPQVGLEAGERKRNLRGVFAMEDRASVRGLRLVVLDDVRTTGSTLSECAATLRAAGAAAVYGLTISFEA
ncbi:MAG: ComF family protein [Actinomycetota bacterium]